jgi:hypothetical protein
VGLSSDALLPSRATNAWAMGTSTDDVSTLGGVVRSVGSAADALSPRMVQTSWMFWPRKLLHRRWLLRECRPPTGQKDPKIGKPDGPEPQTRWSSFPEGSNNSWSVAQAVGA